MSLALDTSALVAAHVANAARTSVLAAMEADAVWCVSSLALSEALVAVDRLTDDNTVRRDLEDSLRYTWDHLHVVPVDQRCLDRAVDLARAQPLLLTHAIHLAAADRLPRPVRFVTFDPAQIPVALSLGFDVVSMTSTT